MVAASASKFKVLHYFQNTSSDGIQPDAGLIDVKGFLYGTTALTGSAKNQFGPGTVFSIDPSTGAETIVHAFKGKDGALPEAGLISRNGTLYGTTSGGGHNGGGTVFSIDPSTGAESVVYSFLDDGKDGNAPEAPLVYLNGRLFGTTAYGGLYNLGTVFEVNLEGAETVIHSFSGRDGDQPVTALIKVGDVLYGTTAYGGEGCKESGGCGTIFKVTKAGDFSVLYTFPRDQSHGAYPFAPLIYSNRVLYGTALEGGTNGGGGTVFSLDPATGEQVVLHSFPGGTSGSMGPDSLLQVGRKLYGTSEYGGDDYPINVGTIFALSRTTGTEADVHFFKSGKGTYPAGGMINVGGVLYGTTPYTSYINADSCCHGIYRGGYGTVFAFEPGGSNLQ